MEQPDGSPRRYSALGLQLAALDFESAIDLLCAAPKAKMRIAVHFCTVNTVIAASSETSLSTVLNGSNAIVFPDGMPIVWLGRVSGKRVDRICGPDFMPALVARSRSFGYRHFLYGGADGVADELRRNLLLRFPGAKIVGTYSPPFRTLTRDEDQIVVDLINRSQPDFVWVGLGTPKQDFWIANHRDQLNASALLAVGAAFDFHSGRLTRAPVWMRGSGLEWLFRLMAEPRRLWRRYTISNIRFAALLARTAFESLLVTFRRTFG